MFLEDRARFDNKLADFRQANWRVFLGLKAKGVSRLPRVNQSALLQPSLPAKQHSLLSGNSVKIPLIAYVNNLVVEQYGGKKRCPKGYHLNRSCECECDIRHW